MDLITNHCSIGVPKEKRCAETENIKKYSNSIAEVSKRLSNIHLTGIFWKKRIFFINARVY